MGIHSSTHIKAYQLKKGGAPARFAILKMIAADSAKNANPHTRLTPGDWKGARHWTLETYAAAFINGLNPGFNGEGFARVPVWYSHNGPNFRNEKPAHECEGGPDHKGWHTNSDGTTYKDGSGAAWGIVGRLTHGHFIAGYQWGDNDERVYFPAVFDCEREAARAADSHAENFAYYVREDNGRFEEMKEAEDEADDARKTARKALMARNVSPEHREDAREALEALREALEALKEKTADYENGGK